MEWVISSRVFHVFSNSSQSSQSDLTSSHMDLNLLELLCRTQGKKIFENRFRIVRAVAGTRKIEHFSIEDNQFPLKTKITSLCDLNWMYFSWKNYFPLIWTGKLMIPARETSPQGPKTQNSSKPPEQKFLLLTSAIGPTLC